MKIFLFVILILLLPVTAFAKDTFFVDLTDAVSEEKGKVSLSYTFTNGGSLAVSYMDIEPHESINLENIELPIGWFVLGKNKKSIRLGTTGFFPNTSVNIKFRVRVIDPQRINIFQVREPLPVFTLTIYYANNTSKSWSIHKPFMPKMR